MAIHDTEYKGHRIAIRNDFRFTVDLGSGESATYDTYNEATARIDRLVATEEAVKKEKLQIQVYDAKGGSVLVTGIHAATGILLTKPKLDPYGNNRLYPQHPKVAAILGRRLALEQEMGKLDEVLGELELEKPSKPYRVLMDEALYVKFVNNFKMSVETKTKLADKLEVKK